MFSKLKKDDGFTIIEVLIVIAIAGLIMLIVFLAIPQLRRSQHNSSLRAQASRLISAVTEYESNANGAKVSNQIQADQIRSGVDVPDFTGIAYLTAAPSPVGGVQPAPAAGTPQLAIGTCSGTDIVVSSTARTYALRFLLDGGQVSCLQS